LGKKVLFCGKIDEARSFGSDLYLLSGHFIIIEPTVYLLIWYI